MPFPHNFKQPATSNRKAKLGKIVGYHRGSNVLAGIALLGLFTGVSFAQAPEQQPPSTSTYSNEVFAGGTYARANSGPDLNDTNFGGWDLSAAHYLTPFLGATVDVQGLYGHAPIAPSQFISANPLVSKYVFMAGPQLRWRQGYHRFDASLRLLAGVTDTNAQTPSGAVSPNVLGLYPNATKFAFKPGGTFDINLSPRMAIRYSAGVLLERENGDFQRDFDLSAGLVFRFGK
jgi:hypothetical protein